MSKISPHLITEQMARVDTTTIFTVLLVILVLVGAIYLLDPTFFGLMPKVTSGSEGFADAGEMDDEMANSNNSENPGESQRDMSGQVAATMGNAYAAASGSDDSSDAEGFADVGAYDSAASFGSASAPAGCYPRDQLTPAELLPSDQNSIWAQQNPMGTGSLKGKNFLSAGALIGVNTVGQSLRNANLQLRSEPPAPQVAVSIFNQSTIEPDINRRPLEIA
jgi:hypothetical protein